MSKALSGGGVLIPKYRLIPRVTVPPIQCVPVLLGAIHLARCAMAVLVVAGNALTRQMRVTLMLVVHRVKPAHVVLEADRFKGTVGVRRESRHVHVCGRLACRPFPLSVRLDSWHDRAVCAL